MDLFLWVSFLFAQYLHKKGLFLAFLERFKNGLRIFSTTYDVYAF